MEDPTNVLTAVLENKVIENAKQLIHQKDNEMLQSICH